MSVIIQPVESRKQLRAFVKFPLELYKGCPYYVPETGACLLADPKLECDDYAAFIEDEDEIMGMVDMYALNP